MLGTLILGFILSVFLYSTCINLKNAVVSLSAGNISKGMLESVRFALGCFITALFGLIFIWYLFDKSGLIK